jgi:hypothetical protein
VKLEQAPFLLRFANRSGVNLPESCARNPDPG